MSKETSKRDTRDPFSLKPYPRQQEAFGPINDVLVKQLAKDMDIHGLAQLPEILPDGTILAGHHRVEAAKKLGWREIEVVVRYDLANSEPAVRDHHFLTDNMLRNNYGPITEARIIKLFVETRLELGDISGRRRDRIAKAIKAITGEPMSGKKIDRLLTLLELPVSLQHLVENGALSQAKALKIARLSRADQESLAEDIAGGAGVADAVDSYLDTGSAKSTACHPNKRIVNRVARLCRDLGMLDHEAIDLAMQGVRNSDLRAEVKENAAAFVGSFNSPTTDATNYKPLIKVSTTNASDAQLSSQDSSSAAATDQT